MRPAALLLALTFLPATSSQAQGPRRLTTVEGLRQFPGFYHLQPVLVRGQAVESGPRFMLRTDEHEIRLMLDRGVSAITGGAEVRGVLIDVGRLETGDGRLSGYERPVDAPWPKPGEEMFVSVTSVTALPNITPPLSFRALALDPARFEGQTVTIAGQFRGRNLFGDLPGAPRRSQYDFVLKNGDAALWIVGMRPRGKGFELSIDARIDTNRWLEVSGTVRRAGGLVTIEAARLALASSEGSPERPEPAAPPPPLSPVEVVFSSPTADEIEVPPGTTVRIQFSRNVKPESLTGHVRVAYADGDPAADRPTALDFKSAYDAAARAVTLTFAKPLDAARRVRIQLDEGVVGFDGAPVTPWSMTFTVGP